MLQPSAQGSYSKAVLSTFRSLEDLTCDGSKIILDGQSLNVSSVVAAACHQVPASISKDPQLHARLRESVELLARKLAEGEIVYGVNTGFGGSADTRTDDYSTLQQALVQHQASGVLLPTDRSSSRPSSRYPHGLRSHSMPTAVVKAAMLVRCNSLLRGHSAVRPEVIEHILAFLRSGLIPVVPVRGSISASGDLSPLSYIANALEGNPDIAIQNEATGDVIRADEALQQLGLAPLRFGPKEGLGLLNGTAFSAGAASLVLFEANQLVLLSQVLTAMGTEALAGSTGNYHPFIAGVRPHRGQIEAAGNIFHFLRDSRMATSPGADGASHSSSLAQDRYALRTASQWIGPQIEDMSLASEQVHCELNSTTDNPLLDPGSGHMHHGGNFQATSITSAMEKTMSAMQMLGRMIFSQCTELINPALNNGLPPNLSFDDPSLSFTMKGIDINMSAYMAELSYLNHHVSNHVQSAEMHNQGLNSLALVASRYAAETVEVLSLMASAYLYALCQALDLRACHLEFLRNARSTVDSLTAELCLSFSPLLSESDQRQIQDSTWEQLLHHWNRSSTSDLHDRSRNAASHTMGALVELLPMQLNEATALPTRLAPQQQWLDEVSATLAGSYDATRAKFQSNPTTPFYLCSASRRMYEFVRKGLGVPLHRGIVDHPTYPSVTEEHAGQELIGSQVSKIYMALRGGVFRDVLQDCWYSSDSVRGFAGEELVLASKL
ncbi:phenylalanine/tyrosine ammonia-lyase [Aspergillus lentulus]|uniref:Phenylalanine ammonia-lyase lenB n=1 Tax=Aspergillus lentulus TaxID=293939 RepID=LENB_ASPLE|nr:phenylalanine/tyrosine ammonia-lyase [Aspergillus lentulus]